MATPKPALQAVLERNFETAGYGWLPANAQPPDRLTTQTRCQAPTRTKGSWLLRTSPVKVLFEDRVDMDRVCDWFMQTTETRSLAITRRSKFGKQLGPEGFRLVRRQCGAQQRRGAARGGGGAAKLVGKSCPGNRKARDRRRAGRGRGWNLHQANLNNWWSRKLLERKSRKRQRETPTAAPQGHQKRRKGDKNCGQTEYLTDWSDFPSPAVLYVTGTNYKLVPVGNTLPAMRELSATGAGQPAAGGSCPRRGPQESLLTEAKRQLGCLRKCWVLLRNIGDSKALDSSQSSPWASGKSAPVKVDLRKRRRWVPAYCRRRAPDPQIGAEGATGEHEGDSRLTENHHHYQVHSVNRAESQANPTTEILPYVDLTASPETGPASSDQLENPLNNQEEQGDCPFKVQQENVLADVKWQLVHLKECRVILRKIKAVDSNPLSGLAAYQPPNLPSPSSCQRLDQDLENKEESEKAEHHAEPSGTDSFFREDNQDTRLAANNQGAVISAFAKGFNSSNELENTVKPDGKDMRNTFTETDWKLRGLKECRVVLKKIVPLDGNHFISLADGQIFRLGRDGIHPIVVKKW